MDTKLLLVLSLTFLLIGCGSTPTPWQEAGFDGNEKKQYTWQEWDKVNVKAKDYKVGDVVKLRSPVYCESPKICHTCYGDLLKRHKTPYIGVLAGSSIGERGTQLIMRTFHTGGAATMAKRDMFEDVIQNDPIADLEK